MFDNPVVNAAVVAYLVLVLIKTILCWSNIPAALYAYNYSHGRGSTVFRLASFIVAIPLVICVLALPLLINERLRFFFVYSNRKVIHDVITAFASDCKGDEE